MNNKLRDIHNIYVAKDVFEKTFYIARESGICECKVVEIGLCLDENEREQGYVKLAIAGEEKCFVTQNGLGFGVFPTFADIHQSWKDCIKRVNPFRVFDVSGGTRVIDAIPYDMAKILTDKGHAVNKSCLGTNRITCFAVSSVTHSITTKESAYSVCLDKDGLHCDVAPAEGYYNTMDEAIQASCPPIVTFKSA